jgi:ParB family chromosome partitioning protein
VDERLNHLPERWLNEPEPLEVAFKLDMTHYWQPTAGGYFGRVSKGLMREGIGPAAAAKIDGLKKTRWRNAPRPFSPGKAWLPTLVG